MKEGQGVRRLLVIKVALTSSLLLYLLVHPAWYSWFSVDDSAVLMCSQYSTWDLLFDRDTAIFCNPLFFTPIWPLVFKPDISIWELAPQGYRVTNLAIAAAACGALWSLMRARAGPAAGWIAVVMLASSMPMAFGVAWITRRHYLAGFVLALVAIWTFSRFLEQGTRGEQKSAPAWLLGSVGAFFLAILSKEAYAFLPAVIFLLVNGGIKRRLALTLPYAVALAFYLLWRVHMLGGFGGYPGEGFSLNSLAVRAAEQLSELPSALYGDAGWSLMVPLMLLLWAKPRLATTLVLILVASLAPLVLFPGSGIEHASKAFGASAVVAVGFGFAWSAAASYPAVRVTLALTLAVAVLGSATLSSAAVQRAKEMGDQFEERYRAAYAEQVHRVLVVGDFPYYFTAMNLLHERLRTGNAKDLIAISSDFVLPVFADRTYERVVLEDGDRLDGEDAARYVSDKLRALADLRTLASPRVVASRRHRSISFASELGSDERLVRCAFRSNYANCIQVGRDYTMGYPSREPIQRVDFFSFQGREMSPPTTVIPKDLELTD